MNIWEAYKERTEVQGRTSREVALNRESFMIRNKLRDTLSFFEVPVDNVIQEVAIINTDIFNEKTIISLPSEDIRHGSLVEWEDSHWLVTERDSNTTVYTRAKMVQCNHLLKWVTADGVIHEQWCVIEDGTKYLTGEYEDRNFVVTRGDSRIAMTIAKNEHTSNFGREHRFLIDDPDSNPKLSYLLTKPLKLGSVYNNEGVFKFVLQEVNSTDYDNHEIGVADYYKYFSKDNNDNIDATVSDNISEETGKKRWI